MLWIIGTGFPDFQVSAQNRQPGPLWPRLRQMGEVKRAPMSRQRLDGGERLADIGDQVIGIFLSHGQPHRAGIQA
jgi:hypothetical protein